MQAPDPKKPQERLLKPAILKLLGFMKSKDNLNIVLKNESFLMIVVHWMMLTTQQ